MKTFNSDRIYKIKLFFGGLAALSLLLTSAPFAFAQSLSSGQGLTISPFLLERLGQ